MNFIQLIVIIFGLMRVLFQAPNNAVIVFFILFHTCFLTSSAKEQDRFEALWSMLPNEAPKAEPLIRKYIDSLEISVNDTNLTKAYCLMGRAQYFLGRYRVASSFYEKALARADIKQMPAREALVLIGLGVVKDLLEQVDGAMGCYTQAAKIADQLNDTTLLVKTWINTGLLERKVGNTQKAIDITLKALEVSQRQGDESHIALCYQNLSVFYSIAGNQKENARYAALALNAYRILGNQFLLGRHLINMSFDYVGMKNYLKAKAAAEEVLKIANELESPDLKIAALSKLGQIAGLQMRLNEAEKYLDEAMKLAIEIENQVFQEDILIQKMDVYAYGGKFKEYLKVHSEAIDLRQKINSQKSKVEFEEYQVLYELDKMAMKNEQLVKDNEALSIQRILLGSLALVFLVGGLTIYRQHRKLTLATQGLFKLNVAQVLLEEEQTISKFETKGTPSLNQENPKQTFSDDEVLNRFYEIKNRLEQEKLYTDPELNLQKLTQLLGSNQKYISEAINRHAKSNFSGLVNKMRVNEARRILLKNSQISLNVLMDEVGFNNRVTFYRQFKSQTGLSPTEFQQMLQSNPEEAVLKNA